MSTVKDLQRIEAFSDGVFAIASTLLILEIKVPHIDDVTQPGALWQGLKEAWPSFMAFVISFGSILVMWVNHHRAIGQLASSSPAFMFANGFLLLTVTFVPFPTAVLAHYIDTPQANVAVVFYSSSYLLSNIAFNVWWLTMQRPVYLLPPHLTKAQLRDLTNKTVAGMVIYLTTTILSYWFPVIGLIIIFSLFILWITLSIGEKKN